MLRTVKKSFNFSFSRSGGSIVIAQVDVWQATVTGWQLVKQFKALDSTQVTESMPASLSSGSYTCVFQCFVTESLNGKYSFSLDVDNTPTYSDTGDVNTTSAPNDSKVYKDQFILTVQ